jgi:hypothetical protein
MTLLLDYIQDGRLLHILNPEYAGMVDGPTCYGWSQYHGTRNTIASHVSIPPGTTPMCRTRHWHSSTAVLVFLEYVLERRTNDAYRYCIVDQHGRGSTRVQTLVNRPLLDSL